MDGEWTVNWVVGWAEDGDPDGGWHLDRAQSLDEAVALAQSWAALPRYQELAATTAGAVTVLDAEGRRAWPAWHPCFLVGLMESVA